MDKIELIKKLYKDSYNDEEIDMSKISELNIIYDNDSVTLGDELLKNQKVGVVVFSGGNATRLGLNKAKGFLTLKYKEDELSIFEIFILKLKNAYKKYGTYINIYFMTSSFNNDDIIKYFEDNNYFSYPKENVHFFMQDNLPIVDESGNIMYSDKDSILEGPNGNGDVFRALKESGCLNDIRNKNIEYLVFSTIDNIMLKLLDTKFFDAVLKNKYTLASKSISKKSDEDKEWIFVKYNNHPYMLPSRCITNDLFKNKSYREKNITYHFIKTSLVEDFCNIDLPYHRNYKLYSYYDKKKDEFVISTKKNAFKFEKFIFDAFYYADDMLLYSIKDEEFMPIKNSDDILKVCKKLNDMNLEDLI